MVHFVEGFKNFESMGAPELHGPMMTWEDVQFARKMNKTEIEHCINQEAEFFDEKEEDYSEFTRKDCEEFFDNNIQCGACGKDLEEDSINFNLTRCLEVMKNDAKDDDSLATALFIDTLDNDEKVRESKIYMKMQELGLCIDIVAHAKAVKMPRKLNTFHYERKQKIKPSGSRLR